MLPRVDDTSDEALEVQLALLRAAGPERRFQLMRRMTNHAIARSRAAIAAANPELSDLEVKLAWAEIHYGVELTDKVRAALAKRS